MTGKGKHETHRDMSKGQELFYWFCRGIVWLGAKLGFRLKTEGRDKLWTFKGKTKSKSAVYAANHFSMLDPPMISVSVPFLLRSIAKDGLFKGRFLRFILGYAGSIAIDRRRGGEAIRYAERALNNGYAVLIFPEGMRSEINRMGKCSKGAILMAIRAKCPIVPVGINGTFEAWGKKQKSSADTVISVSRWAKLAIKFYKAITAIKFVPIKVVFGTPYSIDYRGDTTSIPQEVIDLEVERLAWKIRALLKPIYWPSYEQMVEWYGEVEEGSEQAKVRADGEKVCHFMHDPIPALPATAS